MRPSCRSVDPPKLSERNGNRLARTAQAQADINTLQVPKGSDRELLTQANESTTERGNKSLQTSALPRSVRSSDGAIRQPSVSLLTPPQSRLS